MKKRVLYMNRELMPQTTALLRAVFGTHELPLQQAPVTALAAPSLFTHMEAALAGVDYVKLLIAGNTRLPVLTLVGGAVAAQLFLRWLREVVGVPVRTATDLQGILYSSAQPGLVVHEADGTEGVLPLMHVINSAADVCLDPGPPHLHEHVNVKANLCLLTPVAPPKEIMLAMHWVRPVQEIDASNATMEALRHEYGHLLTLMYHKPFLTKPHSPYWFAEEMLQDTTKP